MPLLLPVGIRTMEGASELKVIETEISRNATKSYHATAADLQHCTTVGGMTPENAWWAGACRGGVEILAPSQAVFSASITANDHYRGTRPNFRSGTSFGAPIISGIAARLLAENPELSPQELESIIVATPSRIFNPDPAYAGGRVATVQEAPAVMTARIPHAPLVTLAP